MRSNRSRLVIQVLRSDRGLARGLARRVPVLLLWGLVASDRCMGTRHFVAVESLAR